MKALLIFLFVLCSDILVSGEIIPIKNFTRSRYSLRKRTTTTVSSVDDVSDLDGTTLSPISEEITEATTLYSSESTLIDSLVNESTTTSDANSEEVSLSTIANEIESADCGEKIGENHPWIAVLVHTDPSGRSHKKTLSKGVLIDKRHVLTTVSSLHNSKPFWIVSKIRLGDIPTWGGDNVRVNKSTILTVGVEKVFNHKTKDIAVIRLAEDVKFTDNIAPICLPDDDYYNYRELYLHVCKRPTVRSVSGSHSISSVPVAPLLPQDCTIMFNRKKATFAKDEFCAWDETGDTCTGDLGGPLTGKLNGRYQVIGLNSYIYVKDEFDTQDYPGIYTRIGSHLKWLKAVLKYKE